ncbi:hypothetical protein J2T57_001393 [Natronocella acetinitrilica]|uniref:Uncharacterized protein n=1 Tax=Natronocella acetinitrilica TaxID=414046 RepID=A0AAE3G3X2_9GAMM|nr:hypothetical protein [Natronocella acetinitrilica]MCP1674291.1 hypothetical protein [Natronocella acetinitrilica]
MAKRCQGVDFERRVLREEAPPTAAALARLQARIERRGARERRVILYTIASMSALTLLVGVLISRHAALGMAAGICYRLGCEYRARRRVECLRAALRPARSALLAYQAALVIDECSAASRYAKALVGRELVAGELGAIVECARSTLPADAWSMTAVKDGREQET